MPIQDEDIVVLRPNTSVIARDQPGHGNARHEYDVVTTPNAHWGEELDVVTTIRFQNGPVKEHGINGCQLEDLIEVCIDRLQGFQSGDYACETNAAALSSLNDALESLESRTRSRVERGVEGTSLS